MKILQNIVLSVALATSMVAFSTSTMAAEKKEVASVNELIETTITHIEAAATAANAGEKTEVVLAHLHEAKQTQKDIIVGALEQQRSNAGIKLTAARTAIKAGKTEEGKAALAEALKAYKDLLTAASKK